MFKCTGTPFAKSGCLLFFVFFTLTINRSSYSRCHSWVSLTSVTSFEATPMLQCPVALYPCTILCKACKYILVFLAIKYRYSFHSTIESFGYSRFCIPVCAEMLNVARFHQSLERSVVKCLTCVQRLYSTLSSS